MTSAPAGQQRFVRCPYCHSDTAAGRDACPICGTRLTGPELTEIAWIDGELSRLGEYSRQLTGRRVALLATLRTEPLSVEPGQGAAEPGQQATTPDVSRTTAATLLLTAGALLLGLAALFFAAVNWGRIGPGGRVSVLAAAAVIALAAAGPLARRRLRGTAEAVTSVGLALTLLVALAARQLPAIQTLGPAHLYGAVVSAILAALWAAHGSLTPTRAGRPAAIVLGQLCLPLAAAPYGLVWMALALFANAVADVAIIAWSRRREAQAESVTGVVVGALSWLTGGLLALLGVLVSSADLRFTQLIALLALAIAIGSVGVAALSRALRPAVIWPAAAMAAGAVTVVAVAGSRPARPALLLSWAGACVLICAIAAAVMVRRRAPARVATTLAVAAGSGLALAAPLAAGWPVRLAGWALLGLAATAAAAATLSYRRRWVLALMLDAAAALAGLLAAAAAHSNITEFCIVTAALGILAATAALRRTGKARVCAILGAVAAAGASLILQLQTLGNAAILPARALVNPWHGGPAARALAVTSTGLPLAVAILAAAVLTGAVVGWAWRGRDFAIDAGVAGLVVLAGPAAALIQAGEWATPAALLALAITLLAVAVARFRPVRAVAATVAALLALSWALAGAGPTVLVLGCLAAGYAVTAWRASDDSYRAVAGLLAVLAAGGLAATTVLAAGLPGRLAGSAVIAVASAAIVGSRALSERARSISQAIEPAGWLLLLAGLTAELGNGPDAGLALTAISALCLATSARPERGLLRAAGIGLMPIAAACWLAGPAGPAPEPYTLPAAGIALVAGWSWSRRPPQVSSWSFAGPGLALGLVPTLGAALAGHGWIRPLTLLTAAAAVAITGARARLAAALVLGTAVAVIAAGRLLGPAAVHLALQLPRWVPVAIIGAVLLGCGATFEARLRDMRKLRDAVRKMR